MTSLFTKTTGDDYLDIAETFKHLRQLHGFQAEISVNEILIPLL